METPTTTQGENCIFCKIVAREIPAEIVYEDAGFIAFLDIHPQTPGHVQVIPKKHYRWVWDVPSNTSEPDSIGAYFTVAQKIAHAQRAIFNTEWILSKTVGDEVHHAHLWVFPSNAAVGDKMDLAGNAEKLRAALTTQ